MKKSIKQHYIGLNKATNKIILAGSKVEIAKFIGISTDTLNRRLDNKSEYSDEEWSVWCNIVCKTIKRGYRLKPAKAYQY